MLIRLIATGLLLALTLSSAEEPCHFTVRLEVAGAGAKKTVQTSTPSVPSAEIHRPLLEVPAGTEITIDWTVTALEKNPEPLTDITVHSFLAREEEVGQKSLPALDDAAVLETALLMDFSAGDTSRGSFKIVLDEPGVYLVRVETMGLAATELHEHSTALEIKAAPADAAPKKPAGAGKGEGK